jgi:hypothetical protein
MPSKLAQRKLLRHVCLGFSLVLHYSQYEKTNRKEKSEHVLHITQKSWQLQNASDKEVGNKHRKQHECKYECHTPFS